MIFEHKSVLLMETVDSLNVKPDGIYVDGTLGGGGHAYEVSRRLGEKGRLIGIDQDADAIAAATERLLPFKDKVTIVRSNYKNIREVLFNLGIEKVDGIYLDLGVSSYQLDTADRGFSYREDAPLDMRMDQRNDKTAADIVNGYSEMERIELSAITARIVSQRISRSTSSERGRSTQSRRHCSSQRSSAARSRQRSVLRADIRQNGHFRRSALN